MIRTPFTADPLNNNGGKIKEKPELFGTFLIEEYVHSRNLSMYIEGLSLIYFYIYLQSPLTKSVFIITALRASNVLILKHWPHKARYNYTILYFIVYFDDNKIKYYCHYKILLISAKKIFRRSKTIQTRK